MTTVNDVKTALPKKNIKISYSLYPSKDVNAYGFPYGSLKLRVSDDVYSTIDPRNDAYQALLGLWKVADNSSKQNQKDPDSFFPKQTESFIIYPVQDPRHFENEQIKYAKQLFGFGPSEDIGAYEEKAFKDKLEEGYVELSSYEDEDIEKHEKEIAEIDIKIGDLARKTDNINANEIVDGFTKTLAKKQKINIDAYNTIGDLDALIDEINKNKMDLKKNTIELSKTVVTKNSDQQEIADPKKNIAINVDLLKKYDILLKILKDKKGPIEYQVTKLNREKEVLKQEKEQLELRVPILKSAKEALENFYKITQKKIDNLPVFLAVSSAVPLVKRGGYRIKRSRGSSKTRGGYQPKRSRRASKTRGGATKKNKPRVATI